MVSLLCIIIIGSIELIQVNIDVRLGSFVVKLHE